MKAAIHVRFANATGGWHYRPAEVLAEYPALGRIRVRLLDSGQCAHVHRNSVVSEVPA
jgi:hypothetical protein